MGGALASTFGAAATSVSKKVLSLPGSYVTALLATIPVSWLLSELLPSPSAQFGKSERTDKEKLGVLLRAVAAGGIGSFILVLPTGLDKNKQSTMVASVFCGFFLLTTVKSLMFPDVNPDVPMHQNLSGRSLLTSFANYATPFAKIFFPVFEVEPKLRLPTDEQVQRSLYCLAVALAKLLALPLLSTQAFRLADLPSPSLAQRHVFPPLIWAAKVLAGTWQFDLLEAFVPLFTFGRYQSAPFNNNLLASTSISEFWAYRYNRMVSLFLRRTVHDPLRHRSVAGPLAATLTFAASGLLHSYVAHCTFGKGQVSSLLYFLTHAAAVHFEHRHLSQVGKPVVNVAFLLAVLVATFPLYPQLFLSAGKTWLDSETLAPAWTYKVMSRVVPSLVDI